MNKLRALLIAFLVVSAFLSAFQIYSIEVEKGKVKDDLVELSKVKYGLFNVDEWKSAVSEIIRKKIDELEITEDNRDAMRRKVRVLLTKVLNDFEESYYEEKSGTLKGWIQGKVAVITGTFDKLRDDIPEITETILNFLEEKENREAISNYLTQKLDEYADSTFSDTDYSTYNSILEKYGCDSKADATSLMNTEIARLADEAFPWKIILIICMVLAATVLWISRHFSSVEYLALTLLSLGVLGLGLALPMIEIDARITHIGFKLLGEPMSFDDQVLYFKSKSILEVIRLMFAQAKPELILVGLLVLMFSVIFPVSKLISTVLFLGDAGANKAINFLVFKTGKWSMADVLVVAIFMAYLGFDGIITEQLRQVEQVFQNIEILTTNNSQLLFGFFAFMSFVLLSLLISQRLNARLKEKEGF